MYVNTLDPAIFHLGPLEVRWYGLVYVLGFLIAGWLLQKNRHLLQLSKDDVWDLLLYKTSFPLVLNWLKLILLVFLKGHIYLID